MARVNLSDSDPDKPGMTPDEEAKANAAIDRFADLMGLTRAEAEERLRAGGRWADPSLYTYTGEYTGSVELATDAETEARIGTLWGTMSPQDVMKLMKKAAETFPTTDPVGIDISRPETTTPGRTGVPPTAEESARAVVRGDRTMLVRFEKSETRGQVKLAASREEMSAAEWLREAVREKLARQERRDHPERTLTPLDGKTRPVELDIAFEHDDDDKIQQTVKSLESVIVAMGGRDIRIANKQSPDYAEELVYRHGYVDSDGSTYWGGHTDEFKGHPGSDLSKWTVTSGEWGVTSTKLKPSTSGETFTDCDFTAALGITPEPPVFRDTPFTGPFRLPPGCKTTYREVYPGGPGFTAPGNWMAGHTGLRKIGVQHHKFGIDVEDWPDHVQAAVIEDLDLLDKTHPWLCLDDGFTYDWNKSNVSWEHKQSLDKYRLYHKHAGTGAIMLAGNGLGISGIRTAVDEHGNRV